MVVHLVGGGDKRNPANHLVRVKKATKNLLRRIPGYDPFRNAAEFRFDEAEGFRAVEFFPTFLCHTKGTLRGKPFELSPWQQAIIANLFGWKRKSDGTRRYREAFIFIPRKQGKSILAAGIGNYVLFCDGEPGAEIYCAAAERDQARLVFEMSKEQVLENKVLSEAAGVFRNAIALERMGSSFKAISAEANTKHGYNPHCVIFDELHAQKDGELVDVLETGMGARRQPLMVFITTSDFDRAGSICNEKHAYACKVRDGIIENPYLLPVIYEAGVEDDWKSKQTWEKANPNLGISVSLDFFEREAKKAEQSPRYENTFKRLYLNIRTSQDVRWLPMDYWDQCVSPDGRNEVVPRSQEEARLHGRTAFGGLDLSTTRDITAFVLVFPFGEDVERRYDVLPYFFLPEITAKERSRADGIDYLSWAQEGWLELTGGNAVDYKYVRRRINELREHFRFKEIAIDPWNSSHIGNELQEDDGFEVFKFSQGYSAMNGPSKELERLVVARKLTHSGNPVLRWMASNVAAEEDSSGNIKPSKKRSGDKIDGIVAMIMAIGRAMVGRDQRSVYETRDMLVI